MQGQRLLSKKNLQKEEYCINIQNYPRGLYGVKVVLEAAYVQIKKLV